MTRAELWRAIERAPDDWDLRRAFLDELVAARDAAADDRLADGYEVLRVGQAYQLNHQKWPAPALVGFVWFAPGWTTAWEADRSAIPDVDLCRHMGFKRVSPAMTFQEAEIRLARGRCRQVLAGSTAAAYDVDHLPLPPEFHDLVPVALRSPPEDPHESR